MVKLIDTTTTLSTLRGALRMLEAIAEGKTFGASDYYTALIDIRDKIAEAELRLVGGPARGGLEKEDA